MARSKTILSLAKDFVRANDEMGSDDKLKMFEKIDALDQIKAREQQIKADRKDGFEKLERLQSKVASLEARIASLPSDESSIEAELEMCETDLQQEMNRILGTYGRDS